jgi:NADP-dependent 3-hydroxy acid dehydrogenase YdfG
MTGTQYDASAKPPCTRTTVGVFVASLMSAFLSVVVSDGRNLGPHRRHRVRCMTDALRPMTYVGRIWFLLAMTTDQNGGRVAVITGASSGIGEATARSLAADGHRVALLARRADRIEALAGELGERAIAIEADVTDRDAIVAAAQRVRDELGGVDILVNNAGVMLLAPFTSDQRAEHQQMVEVNLLGAITTTEVFLDQLRDGGGDLVNMSSVAGRTARPGIAVYAATKWGMNGWSEALRQELHPDVRVMLIEPGAVATELTHHITDADTKQRTEQMYDATAITPEDIAEVVAFAVSRPRRMTLNEVLVRPTAQL